MEYTKPWIKIQRFDIVENIAADGASAGTTLPNPDESNDPFYEETVTTNAFNLGQ